jgi:hypothetical protein
MSGPGSGRYSQATHVEDNESDGATDDYGDDFEEMQVLLAVCKAFEWRWPAVAVCS